MKGMEGRIMKKKIIPLSILLFSLIVSLIFYIVGDKYKSLRFKFYHELSDRIVLEEREILVSNNSHTWPQRVVEELFLGPISVFNKKLVPFGFKPNSFFVKGKVAYLDLPIEFVLVKDEFDYSIPERLALIEENILLNTWKINSVYITIDGQLPNYDYEKTLNSEEILTDKK